VQLRGANLAAEFPQLTMTNIGRHGCGVNVLPGLPGKAGPPCPRMPPVRISRHLELDSDYAYVAGHLPDHQKPDLPTSEWAWNPVTFNGGRGGDFIERTTVEARSGAVDDRDHADEFKSGIFYGVAAAAFIGALQEFWNALRKGE
jgi:hypothetical protein